MQATEQHAAPAGAAPSSARAATYRALTAGPAFPWIIVGTVTLVGLIVRLIVADQALFGDELATYWVITSHGFPEVVSVVHSNAEITPPLYFVLAWFPAQLSHGEEFIRAPSLVAGTMTIPVVYALGLRTVGRPAAFVAVALTAFSPFMIYYSAEARAYAVMMLLVAVSTLALLLAVERGGRRWWVVYGLSSCLAMYSHYTCGFLLVTQLAWALWAHPTARRPAILANVGALILFLPWATGVRNDLTSPTTDILSALTPFSLDYMRIYLEHWAIGFPYPSAVPMRGLPGAPALVLLGVGLLIALAGLVRNLLRQHREVASRARPAVDRRVLLIVALAASVPVGTALASAVGSNIIGIRNIAASWPAFALALAALLVAAGPRLRYVAAGLGIVAFAIAGLKMLAGDYVRPDHHASAAFVEREAEPGDVVIDATVLSSPGPLSTLDTTLDHRIPTLRTGAPAQDDRPFDYSDPVVGFDEAFARAVSAARGKRIFLVSTLASDSPLFATRQRTLGEASISREVSRWRYEQASTHSFAGFNPAQVRVYVPRER